MSDTILACDVCIQPLHTKAPYGEVFCRKCGRTWEKVTGSTDEKWIRTKDGTEAPDGA